MNRASNGNLGSRSRKREWTDSVVPSRWVTRQQPPRRLGSRRALIGAAIPRVALDGLPAPQSCCHRAGSATVPSGPRPVRPLPGVALLRCGGHWNFNAPSRRTKLDSWEVLTSRFGVSECPRKAKNLVPHHKRIPSRVEAVEISRTAAIAGATDRAEQRPFGGGVLANREVRKGMGCAQGGAP